MDSGAAYEAQHNRKLEVGHVLFMDVVGYSRLTAEEQKRALEQLQDMVRRGEQFRRADEEQRLLQLPTGDGMALVFSGDPEAPLRTAVEVGRALRSHPVLKLRMGIHTGPVYRVEDIKNKPNVAGPGINLAQRVMDCGDAGHILVSEDTARFFSQVGTWAGQLHDIGKTKVKHGVRLHLFSLYDSGFGNPELPRKLKQERRVRRRAIAGAVVLGAPIVAWALLCKFLCPPSSELTGQKQITTNSVALPVNAAAISPNGQYFAYVDAEGISVKDIESGEVRKLHVAAGEHFSFASPNWALAWFLDSNRLLVAGPTGDGKLESMWVFPVIGEPRKLRDKAWLPAVSADGSRIAFVDAETERSIWVTDSDGLEPRIALTAPEGDSFAAIAWSPANTRLAFVETTSQGSDFVGTVDVMTTETTRVIADMYLTSGPEGEFASLCWLPNGRILFVKPSSPGSKGSDLWAVSVDAYSGKRRGKATLVRSDPGIYLSHLSSTSDGKRIAFLKTKLKYSVFLATLESDGGAVSQLKPFISEESNNWASGWTPDSRYVLFTSDRKSGVKDVYRQALGGGSPETLAAGGEIKEAAVAMSDGSSVLYWSWPREGGDNPKDKKLQALPQGRGPPRTLLKKSGKAEFRCALGTPTCVISEEAKDRLRFSRLDPGHSTTQSLVELQLRIAEGYGWDLSPDGTQIAVVRTGVADSEIRIVNLSDRVVSKLAVRQWASFWWIAWGADGKGLYISSNPPKQAALLRVDTSGNARVLWRSDLESFDAPVPSPDGKRLAVTVSSTGESNAWLMDARGSPLTHSPICAICSSASALTRPRLARR